MSLTAKQQRFVDEYLVDLNATQAAIRAGYNKRSAYSIGEENLKKPEVKAAIEAGIEARKGRTQITQDDVLRRFWLIATADPNEIIEHRRTCCRCCYGKGNLYQRTANEMAVDRAAHADLAAKHRADAKQPDPGQFAALGGTGYDARKPPNPECNECFGEGVGTVHVKDTRHLSPGAKALYAGVKQTKDGTEAKLNDQPAALVNVAKHLGMFEETVRIKDGDLPDLSKMKPDEIAKLLAALRPLFAPPHMGGG